MSGYLLDTNTLLIALADPDGFRSAVRDALLAGGPAYLVARRARSTGGNAARPAPGARGDTLPPLHRSFDRILIVQAMAEELTLVTTDGEIPRYASARLQAVS